MEKKRFKILWWLIPFLILLSGLLFPSCGFIGLLFDGDDGGDNTKFFDLTMSYNYSGFRTVSTTSPMVLLFIPLDDNFQFTDDGFSEATYVPNFFSPGVAIVPGLEKGPYGVLGYIDELPFGSPDGQLNMGEAYAFYNMKEFVGSVPQPDYINVDSSIETWIPHFELNDSFFMDGFVVFSPLDGETVYGEGPSLIRVVGLQIEPMIRTIEIRIDAILQGTFPADQEVFLVNMSLYPDGPHTLDITAYDKDMIQVFFDQPPLNMPVNFNYVAP
jgi:hypothetical protein